MTMSDDSDRLDDIASSILDERLLDWSQAAPDASTDEERRCIDALRDVSRIAEFSRELQRTPRPAPRVRAAIAAERPPGEDAFPSCLFRWGHLAALELVGQGSFGDVYRAMDLQLQREVALKFRRVGSGPGRSDDERFDDERFLAEARDLARVRHPNIVVVHGADVHADRIGFWTDYVRGETLAARLETRGPLNEKELALAGLDLCRALRAVHDAGLVHGDVKASNAMIDESGRVVLMDFGAASARDENRRTGRTFGSPLMSAPEVLAGSRPRPVADLYSLGALLFQLASGRTPFVADNVDELRHLLETGERPSLDQAKPGLSASLVAVIERALLRDPRLRYQDAAEMEAALVTAVASPEAERYSLPAEPDALIGRDDQLREIAQRFHDGARLVTLLGAAGIGKTRLAVRCGWQVIETSPSSAWFCDLTESQDLDAIASSVAASLGVPLGKDDPVEQVGRAILARRRCLIVLDNFEQVVPFAERSVGRWMVMAPEARFLVTSRERLKIPGETVQPVEPLSVDSATMLFCARARQQQPGFEPHGPDADAVRELVTLVDAIPLAIELAAARITVMAPAEMVARARDRFRLLAGRGGGRHGALETAIDASWDLLGPWEKAAFAQCSVFQGGFTLEAAEHILDLSAWPEAPWIVDVIQALVDKSLLRAVPGTRPPRFGFFASLQEYAHAKLRADGDSNARNAEARHAQWYARFGSDEILDPRSPPPFR